MSTASQQVHASCVAFEGRAILISGPSGSGKSTLAWDLIGLGALLVADDRTDLFRRETQVFVQRPPSLPPWIEARGLGLLHTPMVDGAVRLELVGDLTQVSRARLPEAITVPLLGCEVPCLHKVDASYFPTALRAYVLHGPANA